MAFKAPNGGPFSPVRTFEVDVLDFLGAGRGKPSSSSSSSLGISRLTELLDSLSLEALAPAWSLMRARVELIADFQRARGLKLSRRPGRSVSVDGVWMVSHYECCEIRGGRSLNGVRTWAESAPVAVGLFEGSGLSNSLIKSLARGFSN